MMTLRNSDLENAAVTLCYKSYQRFCRNWKAATTQYSLHPGNEVKNIHHDAPPRTFVMNNNGSFSRCTCHGRLGYEEQCVHEIVIHKYQFKKELFAVLQVQYIPFLMMEMIQLEEDMYFIKIQFQIC